MYRSAALLLISIALAPALGAETPWEKADYGPCLSFAMDVSEGKLKDTIRFADTRNYVFRARVVSLDAARRLNIAYDTELMRVAGAWSGGFLAYDGATKSMGPPPPERCSSPPGGAPAGPSMVPGMIRANHARAPCPGMWLNTAACTCMADA